MDLINILDQFTDLTSDVDLFYLEIPLGKSGLWVAQTQTAIVPSGYADYNIYYRAKSKQTATDNMKYLSDTIDNLDECLIDGEPFSLKRLYQWNYIGKDAEGYFVFTNVLRLR